jgi:hypothetical protein
MRKSEAIGAPTGREARTILRFVISFMCYPLFYSSAGRTIGCHKEGTTARGFGSEPLAEGPGSLRTQAAELDWIRGFNPPALGLLHPIGDFRLLAPASRRWVAKQFLRDSSAQSTEAAKVGHLATHSFRHTHRSWLDAVGTTIAVRQKLTRHADIRTTMNICGDLVRGEMATAGVKTAQITFQGFGAQTERK